MRPIIFKIRSNIFIRISQMILINSLLNLSITFLYKIILRKYLQLLIKFYETATNSEVPTDRSPKNQI